MRALLFCPLLVACGGNGFGVVLLNEFLAANDGTNSDEAGEFDDWVELFNPGSEAVELGGWSITDDYGTDVPWVLPDMALEAGGHLLVWTDDDAEQGALHTNFKLSALGETLTLLDPAEVVADEVSYDAQTPDVSFGRLPDGEDAWQALTPTPGSPNAE